MKEIKYYKDKLGKNIYKINEWRYERIKKGILYIVVNLSCIL